MSQLKDSEAERENEFSPTPPFCSIQVFNRFGDAPPCWRGGLVCFPQFTNSSVHLIQRHSHTLTWNNV